MEGGDSATDEDLTQLLVEPERSGQHEQQYQHHTLRPTHLSRLQPVGTVISRLQLLLEIRYLGLERGDLDSLILDESPVYL